MARDHEGRISTAKTATLQKIMKYRMEQQQIHDKHMQKRLSQRSPRNNQSLEPKPPDFVQYRSSQHKRFKEEDARKREGHYLKWERLMDKWLCHNRILKKDELFYAVTTLTGSAHKFWLQKEEDLKVHKEPSITTWEELKVILRKKYAPKSTSPQRQQISDCEITNTTDTELPKASDLLLQDISNNSHDMITHLSCPKQAEKGTGEKEKCPREACGQSALDTSKESDLVTKEIIISTESMQLFLKGHSFKCSVFNVSISSIMHLFCPISAQKGTGTMESLMERAEGALEIKEKPPDQLILQHTPKKPDRDMMHLFLSKEPCADYDEALKHTRRKNKHEEDKRFKPPDLDQEKYLDVRGFIIIKEAPPDAAYKPKPSKHKFGIRLLLFDK
ncbi:uncharacterized protein LOC108838004, partial [Raphanus sativus]|uniref:Uncharacterized protein LOC108838004 n=1 Tax=Raphanus sativus TaxID=3726 RepID=A0A9W3D4M6_RAPSA